MLVSLNEGTAAMLVSQLILWELNSILMQTFSFVLVQNNLRIETVRCDKIPLDERICPLCSGNKIEDKTHLLPDCQRYSSMRDIFLSKIETKIDDIRKLSYENLMSQLMNSNDYYVDLRLTVFISSCFEMRDKLIWPFLEYWITVMIYINVAIVPL